MVTNTNENLKVAVVGTGGVGGYFGGLLAQAGHDVTFIARGAHLKAIKENGLRVESQLDGSFTVPGNATDNTAELEPQDLVLFTVKMYHNSDAVGHLPPLIGPDTVVLTLQNGIDNGEILGEAVGESHVMIGSAYMEGRISEPGVVNQAGPGLAAFGEIKVGSSRRGPSTALEYYRLSYSGERLTRAHAGIGRHRIWCPRGSAPGRGTRR